jgi:hypothetical protein
VDIIKFEKIVKIINNVVVPKIRIAVIFFIFKFMKLNKKYVAKKGISMIPINPK